MVPGQRAGPNYVRLISTACGMGRGGRGGRGGLGVMTKSELGRPLAPVVPVHHRSHVRLQGSQGLKAWHITDHCDAS